jgi:predicted RNA-binding Zn ribbon-like protein
VQAFINSNYDLEHDHGAELLASPEALDLWLRRRGLIHGATRATEQDLERALTLREALRALLIAKHDGRDATLDAKASATVHLSATGVRFTAAVPGVGSALDLILTHAAAAQLQGTWARLKACRECSWAFYDHSKNGAGSWCSMKVCGGRVKQRAFYRRGRRQS